LTAALLVPSTLWAQFPSAVVGFNTNPDVPTSHEMFQIPEFSGTTVNNILENVGAFDRNNAFRASGFQTEGAGALNVFFEWADPNNADAWMRLSTFNGAEIPNPVLDTRGLVRFKVTNVGNFVGGKVGVCLGIRETGGVGLAQLENGGSSGPIEWVGVDTTVNGITAGPDQLVDTTAVGDDVQEYPFGFDLAGASLPTGTAVISPGTNGVIDTAPAGDDATRFGYVIGADGVRVPIPAITLAVSPGAVALEWDLSTGVVSVNGSPMGGGIAGFTGNGTLADSPDDIGTLEHIAFTRDPSDSQVQIATWIDELQVEATVPDPTPPPNIQTPVFDTDTTVLVTTISGATAAELFINGGSAGPVAPVGTTATFNGLSLTTGDVLTATQTANATTSLPSPPVTVFAPGVLMADNFDSYTDQADLNAFWTDSINNPAPADAKLLLQAGGAASCPNFLREENPSGANAARLYRSLGGVDGTDADPLTVAWHFGYSGTEGGAGARTRFEMAHFNGGGFSAGVRGDGTVGITLYNQVAGALISEYNLTVRISDPNDPARIALLGSGWVDSGGFLRFPSGVAKEPDVWHKMAIEVRTNDIDYLIDGVVRATIPRPNNTPYDYLLIGEGFSNNGPRMMYDNVAVTQGAAFPFADPETAAPTVSEPIFPGATLVDLTDVDPNSTTVTVFANAVQVGTAAGPFPGGTAAVTVAPALANGASITATQVLGGNTSCDSVPAIVGVTAVTIADSILVPGQTTVQVSNLEEGLASSIAVYSNETTLIGTLISPVTDPATVTVTGLTFGATITATQTISSVEGEQSLGVDVTVPAPTVAGPVIVDDTTVTVTDVHPLATDVTVYINGGSAGTAATGGLTSVDVTGLAAVFINDEVAATQTIGGVESPLSGAVFVEVPFCTVVFEDDLDTDTSAGWNINTNDNGAEGDASATFAVDYSLLGVPASPNGNGSTIGTMFQANSGGTASPAAVSMSPVGLNLIAADGYRLTFDMWINANGPFPAGGFGSTEFYTCGVGYDDATVLQGPPGSSAGATAQTGVGAWFQYTGEGGGASDVRGFKDLEHQFPGSGQYAAGAGGGANNSNFDPYYAALMGDPGPAPPAAQDALFPPNQTGNTFKGSAAFAWHEVSVTVIGARARWEINGTPIITIDATIGNPFSGLDGNVAVGYEDPFSSISGNPVMSFGLVDNVKVLTAGDLEGDVNGDGVVNITDLGILLSNFGIPSGATLGQGDVSGDGAVNITDLGIVLAAFGTSCL
jgi:hypothetical protein